MHNGRVTRALRRLAAVTTVVVLTSGSVAACGGGGEPGEGAQPGSDQSTPSSNATESESPSTSGDAYLPVPDGVQLTPQGSDLAIKDSAVVAWEPRQDQVGVLEVTVTRVERTTFAASFEGWQLDQATRKSTPYFVRATIDNVGASDVGGRDVPLYAVDGADSLIQASTFRATFEPCPGNGVFPETFRPGVTKQVCLVYLVPGGGELTAVSFRPSQDFDPITWTGPIKKPAESKKKSE